MEVFDRKRRQEPAAFQDLNAGTLEPDEARHLERSRFFLSPTLKRATKLSAVIDCSPAINLTDPRFLGCTLTPSPATKIAAAEHTLELSRLSLSGEPIALEFSESSSIISSGELG